MLLTHEEVKDNGIAFMETKGQCKPTPKTAGNLLAKNETKKHAHAVVN